MIQAMKNERKKRKMTQAELAQFVGVSQRAIASYESRERRPSVETAKKIGAALGLEWTLFYEDSETEKSDHVDAFEGDEE